ncbi:MAG: flavodoxin domain-containing protein [Methanospirillum sp.]
MTGRILVAYATKHGSTAGVADAVAHELDEAGFEVEAAALPAVDSLEGYDGVVLGAPLYMGTPLDLAAFVARHRDAWTRVPVAAFATGLTPAAPELKPEQVEQARKALIDALSPIRPVAATLFAGALDPGKMGLAERAVTRLLRAPSGDFRDWNAIGAWTRTLVPLLRGGAGTH